jgi:hypothetical protein
MGRMAWVYRLLVLSAVGSMMVGLMASGASASVPGDFCNGKGQEAVVKVYQRGAESIPLRCGTDRWGFNHVVPKGRWNAAFDSQIAQTISRGTVNRDETIYATFEQSNGKCRELFRVIVNRGAIYGTGFAPQGIITAYETTAGMMEIGHRQASPPVDGQCLIMEPVSDRERFSLHAMDV